MSTKRTRRGFTLLELLVVVAVLGVLVALLLPAISSAREAARRMSCSNNIRNLAVASLHYSSAHGELPIDAIPPEIFPAIYSPPFYWSTHARVLPYLEQTGLDGLVDFGEHWLPESSPARLVHVSMFRCPSDPNRLAEITSHDQFNWGKNNYKCSMGKLTGLRVGPVPPSPGKVIPFPSERVELEDFTDGVSCTTLFAEAVLGDGNPDAIDVPGDWFAIAGPSGSSFEQVYQACTDVAPSTGSAQYSQSGQNWVYNDYVATRYNHVMPPNSKSCVLGGTARPAQTPGATTASSRHPGGVHVAMADGATRFISDAIDVQIWWALGSRDEGDLVPDDAL